MSFFDEPISGEARAFDPFIILPGGGIRSGVAIIPKVGKNVLDDIAFKFGDVLRAFGAPPVFFKPAQKSALDTFRSLLRPSTLKPTSQGAAIKTAPVISVSTGTKALVGGSIAGGTAITYFATSPGGVQVSKSLENIIKPIAEVFKNISEPLSQSPLLLGGLIILGGILLLKK